MSEVIKIFLKIGWTMQANSNDATLRAFVKEDDNTTIVCPQCNTRKTISVSQFRHHLHMLKVKCKCGYVFKAQLEFRRHYRKPTTLPGNYSRTTREIDGYVIKVLNISLSGASFETLGPHDLEVGQTGNLVFTLDNHKETIIKRQVVIKSVQNRRIGCEFTADQELEKDFGFYLRT